MIDTATPIELTVSPTLSGTRVIRSVSGFDGFYTTHYAPMVRLAYVLVDTPEQAEEVVQDAFAKLLPRFDRLGDPESYLRVSVVNGARTALRRRRVARQHARALTDQAARPETDHVLDAVRRLPEPQRSAVVLRYYLDLSEREIADTLGLRPGTVKSTLSRARDRLREVLR